MNRTQAVRPDSRAIAAIRPVRPADEPALSDFFAGLSAQTRYLRFFAPVTPNPSLLHLLSGGAAVPPSDGSVPGLQATAGIGQQEGHGERPYDPISPVEFS